MIYTKEMLISQLKEMNAPQNSVVHMHISLKAVGKTEGYGDGLLDTLIEYFTQKGGLFTIPTHTWAYMDDPSGITLDLSAPKSCIGVLPCLAAKRDEAHRSLHPTHSMAVFGDSAKAEAFIKDEGSYGTPASPKGCYGRLYDNDGYIMLVGVEHNRNTFIHCVEEMLDIPNRLSEELKTLRIKNKDGSIREVKSRSHEAKGIGDVSLRYVKYEKAFRHYNAIVDGKLGNASVQIINTRKIKEIVELIYNRSGGRELMLDMEPLDEELYV
ncbi:MAG: AAC(3) family N-acetyltransferase [Clostridia bacterium]|nr:AAC(3) family N-acetyltransferase [Clostridia bacterium]